MPDQTPSAVPRLTNGHNYARCMGCATSIERGQSHCSVCLAKQGQAPEYLVNLGHGKRPPYEQHPAINPGQPGDTQ